MRNFCHFQLKSEDSAEKAYTLGVMWEDFDEKVYHVEVKLTSFIS